MAHRLVVNKRTDDYDVYIGRGSKWGNPFTHLPIAATKARYRVPSRQAAIDAYATWIREPEQQPLLDSLDELAGKRLGCYCAPLPCHGDTLAELANGPSGFAMALVAGTEGPDRGGEVNTASLGRVHP